MIRDFHKAKKQKAVLASILGICFIVVALQTESGYSERKDWAAIGVGAFSVGLVFVGVVVTSPLVTIAGGAVGAVGIGIAIWDKLDNSDEPEVCSRCNVHYKRGGTHLCIMDYTDAEPLDKPEP